MDNHTLLRYPPAPPAGLPRACSKHLAITLSVVGFVCTGIVVGAAVCGSVLLNNIAPPSPPYHPRNASWAYGRRLMDDKLYGRLQLTQDVGAVCRRALVDAKSAAAHLDVDEAVAGCRFAEWADDN